jgi:NAD-dependent DNA ligase
MDARGRRSTGEHRSGAVRRRAMARRQGGLHFSYLVVAVVMCVGLIFWIVIQSQSLDDLRNLNANLVSKEDAARKSLGELSTKYDALRKVTIGTDESDPDIAELNALLTRGSEDIKNALGKPAAQNYAGLTALYDDTIQALSALKSQLDAQKGVARAKEGETVSSIGEKDTIVAKLNEDIAGQREELNSAQVALERTRTEAREEADRLRSEIESNEEDCTSQKYQLQRELQVSQALLAQAKDRIEHLSNELNKEKTLAMVEPDGKVIRVEEDLGLAWIDLGKDDHLRRGVIFDVFQYVKGGKRLPKGRVEVARIDTDYAEVRILETYDRFNPVAADDQVSSPFYATSDVPVFVFAGEKPVNRRLSQEEMERKIESFGGSVEKAVRIETDYVVALQGYEETEEYKEARKLGITVLREDELLDFIEQ